MNTTLLEKAESLKVTPDSGTPFFVQKYEVRYKFKSQFSNIDFTKTVVKNT